MRASTPRPPIAQVGRPRVHRDIKISNLSLTLRNGAAIPGLLLTPKRGDGPFPGVVAIHQHNYEYNLGKSEVAGLRGDANMAYGYELAARGCAVVVIDLYGFEDRRSDSRDGRSFEDIEAWNLIAAGTSLAARHITELRQLTSWFGRWLDSNASLGVIGHSLGGQLAFFLGACDSRFRGVVVSCGIGTLQSFREHRILHNPSWYVPRLAARGDSMKLCRAYEQPIFVANATNDDYFPLDGVKDAVSAIDKDLITAVTFRGPHSFPDDVRFEAERWLIEKISQ